MTNTSAHTMNCCPRWAARPTLACACILLMAVAARGSLLSRLLASRQAGSDGFSAAEQYSELDHRELQALSGLVHDSAGLQWLLATAEAALEGTDEADPLRRRGEAVTEQLRTLNALQLHRRHMNAEEVRQQQHEEDDHVEDAGVAWRSLAAKRGQPNAQPPPSPRRPRHGHPPPPAGDPVSDALLSDETDADRDAAFAAQQWLRWMEAQAEVASSGGDPTTELEPWAAVPDDVDGSGDRRGLLMADVLAGVQSAALRQQSDGFEDSHESQPRALSEDEEDDEAVLALDAVDTPHHDAEAGSSASQPHGLHHQHQSHRPHHHDHAIRRNLVFQLTPPPSSPSPSPSAPKAKVSKTKSSPPPGSLTHLPKGKKKHPPPPSSPSPPVSLMPSPKKGRNSSPSAPNGSSPPQSPPATLALSPPPQKTRPPPSSPLPAQSPSPSPLPPSPTPPSPSPKPPAPSPPSPRPPPRLPPSPRPPPRLPPSPRPSPLPPSPRPPSPNPPSPRPSPPPLSTKSKKSPPPPNAPDAPPPPPPEFVGYLPDFPTSPITPPSPPPLKGKQPPPSPPSPPAPPNPPLPPSPPYESSGGPLDQVGAYVQVGISFAVAVHLTHIPGTTRYLFMERPSGKHPDKKTFIAGYYDIATNKYTNVPNTDSLFCNGATVMANGNIAVVGGHIAKSGYLDGLKSLRVYDRQANTLLTVNYMKFPRWYPSANLLPDGRILIMGGTQSPGSGTKNNPVCEVWDPQNNPLVAPTTWTLPTAFVQKAGDIFYPNNYILPTGDMFVYCDAVGMILNPYNGNVVTNVPSHTTLIKTVRTEYPFSATSVMLPLTPENNYTPEFVFFGGQFGYGWTTTPAVDLALRLKVTYDSKLGNYTFSNWTMEKMNARRVMGDSVLLPNGVVIVLNGAQTGVAGDSATGGSSKAHYPQFTAVMYDPSAPNGTRFTPLARSQIARMYHSTAALTPDGTIIVAGCDRCDYFNCSMPYSPSPWGLPEYRVEIFYPPFFFWTTRPNLLSAPSNVTYNAKFAVSYDAVSTRVDIDGAVLVAPSSTTHSTNFNQRVVGLVIVKDDGEGTLTLQAPPNRFIAPPGMYMLFLLSGQAYSRAQWVQVQPTTKG